MWQYIIPIFDPDVKNWSAEARLLRWMTFLWLSVGLVVLFSASYALADSRFDNGLYYFIRQLIWLWIGLIGFNFLVRLPIEKLLKIAPWMILLVLGLILITLIPGLGTNINGATRWIKIGPILLQPSEFMKPFLVLQGAAVFGGWPRLNVNQRLTWIAIFGLILAGILLQPNLSTTALCGITLWLIALASGLPLSYMTSTALLGLTMAVVSVTFREYQRKRILSFLNPWQDPRGDGYQLVQSLLAIGSGGTTGSGYGLSQQKLFYLPFPDTDFIFAVFGEEFGFIGGILLLIMLFLYATLALIVAVKCRHRIKKLVAIGAMVILIGQSLLNIGVATGSLPTTGLPFPLFSYGGSSSLASLFLAALLIRVAREEIDPDPVPTSKKSPQKIVSVFTQY
ncbi:MAG: cell division protein FtsW [Microcystis aeruginosa Ma_QC_Ch_20071001_S25]|uniref:Probable peptidoglycan glycosyltransferase FtsW n=1 Tax=Microcystis aeruginosa Ma_QC_Ch_20071001_S25D TaxID=2486250 RepID=A0A552FTP4_MICAE|nr:MULTISPECIES: FtsW/RodA/SpoVE family cell cycle protein [unclassified Microcystis]MCA2764717.1 FtsW/RodA/SpoVE family cell cycle protein [Microcystis sp. M151S2]NCR57193.1 FtsW/RodA/SpoVE family cell cycle protein [Microcystis aeruginosa LL13-06]TRU44603.1 MAG: cell division protein FtsW [Microcystis aeruginosa Ma_QC_Ch_20071001_S25]TRU49987.1 MAG: cell division protein FtsW [Microcystis aeruginosa Ma_QC_Ch_20071001_S25D]TRU65567.1 MAG: cell division protein FtsW [Microcystis aeruginosa Ma_